MPTTLRHAHPADRLADGIARLQAPVCVGLDPVVERMPAPLESVAQRDAAEAVGRFAVEVVEAVAAHVPCVKIQAACFERYGTAGWSWLERAVGAARALGLVVILDGKRGDIGISAEHYAAGAAALGVDWVTANAYLGTDGLRPFLQAGLGVFALVRTSNPSGDALQSLALADGRTVADAVADVVATLGASHVGASGWSSLGAVVGATKPDDAARLRTRMPTQPFLVPGYGAQGGGIDDVRPCFDADGAGAIVTASRSVIHAFGAGAADWRNAVALAAERFADEVGRGVGRR